MSSDEMESDGSDYERRLSLEPDIHILGSQLNLQLCRHSNAHMTAAHGCTVCKQNYYFRNGDLGHTFENGQTFVTDWHDKSEFMVLCERVSAKLKPLAVMTRDARIADWLDARHPELLYSVRTNQWGVSVVTLCHQDNADKPLSSFVNLRLLTQLVPKEDYERHIGALKRTRLRDFVKHGAPHKPANCDSYIVCGVAYGYPLHESLFWEGI